VAIRTPLDVATIMPTIKNVVYGTGKNQPIYNVETMQQIASDSMASQRLPMILLGAFAGLALLLASVGIFGVLSYSVSRRIHEIGIRMALGAERRDVLRMILGLGLRLALAGILIGAVTALLARPTSFELLEVALWGAVERSGTLMAVSLVLVGVSVLACYLSARRASRVNPMIALKYE
jgi:putative ABC transport system permease protein